MKEEKLAIEKAYRWLKDSRKFLSWRDYRMAIKMNKLFEREKDKSILISIMDRAFRAKSKKDIAASITEIFEDEGTPKFFNVLEKAGIFLFKSTSKFLYFFTVPLLKNYIIYFSSRYILFGEDKNLIQRIKANAGFNLSTNVNRVGELLLGEEEAKRRIKRYIKDLETVEIKCVSIKISTIYSQITSISFDDAVKDLTSAITLIYRAAKSNPYIDSKGEKRYKLVNFDMEEYRDLSITVAVFKNALSSPEFLDLQAGIALQAYIPDSFLYLEEIIEFAKERLKKGGAPLRVRIVKGANMEMERFESLEKNWDLATFREKSLTDSNYKKMLLKALSPENIKAVHIGMASHNLFDIAYFYTIARSLDALDLCVFEMLSGMSEGVAKFLAKKHGLNVLLYLPFSSKEDFISSIGYLIRRLDENTGADNYLRYIHALSIGNRDEKTIWKILKEKFSHSLRLPVNSPLPNRKQDRIEGKCDELRSVKFINEPDTDFSLKSNLKWAAHLREKYSNFSHFNVPSIVSGKQIYPVEGNEVKIFNSTDKKKLIGSFYNADPAVASNALDYAIKNQEYWINLSFLEKKSILQKAVLNIKQRRGDFMGIMAIETGKVFTESDSEISEAIDFGNFYLNAFEKLLKADFPKFKPLGLCLVLTPWNFPFAIPAGGIFAALITGNNVIFKPSNLASLTGYELAKCFWDAGVPNSALQFITSEKLETAVTLTKAKEVNFVVFTGSTETALNIISSKPDVKIAAETGGKNFTIATRYADRDSIIKNILHSAFSNSGQKCSATSVLALETELYRDHNFLSSLKDAVLSLKTGYSLLPYIKIGPLVRKPLPLLLQALTSLEEGEEWLVKPQILNNDHTLWSPGVKINVKRGSKSVCEEFFGPLLAIIEIKSLEEGIEIANKSGYGLTSGLESLSIKEQELWVRKIEAGNLYINRPTTGAMVERQPFGGFNKSAFGRGIKAGGENYIKQFLCFEKREKSVLKTDSKNNVHLEKLASFLGIRKKILNNSTFAGYMEEYLNYFTAFTDTQQIPGQQNIVRFLPVSKMAVRILSGTTFEDALNMMFISLLMLKSATIIFETTASHDIFLKEELFQLLQKKFKIIIQNKTEFINIISSFERIKFASPSEVSPEILQEAAKKGVYISDERITKDPRLDLLHFVKEQSISYNYHRYGYIDEDKRLSLKSPLSL